MKIDSYQVGMDSARTYSSSSTRKLTLYESVNNSSYGGAFGNLAEAFGNSQYKLTDSDNNENSESFSNEATTSLQDLIDSMQSRTPSRISQVHDAANNKSIDNVRHRFIQYLWQIFFGPQKANELSNTLGWETDYSDESSAGSSNNNASYSTITLYGVQEMTFEEHESTSFSSNGCIKTADGREISFNLDVHMSRSFYSYYKAEGIPIPSMCDPLVINYSGDVAGLSDQKFYFDLDNDGKDDSISTLSKGNGFLAFDSNEDGIINDGTELFGTKNGDGFAELAEYDSDHNGWIDENDAIYDKLKIWVKDDTGEDKLYSLKEKNVGAIYLGNVDSNYTLTNTDNNAINGAIRKSGIFLYEDGSGASMINHLDIAN